MGFLRHLVDTLEYVDILLEDLVLQADLNDYRIQVYLPLIFDMKIVRQL